MNRTPRRRVVDLRKRGRGSGGAALADACTLSPVVWGERHPVTLTFRDAELESSYEREAAPGRLRMLRFGFAGSILIWSIVAASVWSTGVPNAGATLTIILGIMAPLLLLFLVATRWAHRDWQRQWLGAIANAVAGVVALVTVDLSGAFDRAAVPGVLLVAVFSFICLGLRFVPAALATLVYVGVFSWMRMPRVSSAA